MHMWRILLVGGKEKNSTNSIMMMSAVSITSARALFYLQSITGYYQTCWSYKWLRIFYGEYKTGQHKCMELQKPYL